MIMGCGCSRGDNGASSSSPNYSVQGSGRIEGRARATSWITREPTTAFKSLKTLAFTHTNFLQQVGKNKKGHKSEPDIDIIHWDRAQSAGKVINDLHDFEEEDYEPEIVSLHKTVTHIDSAVLRTTECQTDPVLDEAFDWDLSDKTDIETQTVPPTRANSTVTGGAINIPQDAIVQTDQRLVFLLHRSTAERIRRQTNGHSHNGQKGVAVGSSLDTGQPPSVAHASCQTYVEVQTVAIQVDPSEFVISGFSGASTARTLRRSRTAARAAAVFSDDTSDFSDADIATVHISASSSKFHRDRAKSQKRLVRGRGGAFLTSDHSDPDEIVAVGDDDEEDELSLAPTQSDAGFQVNMEVAVAAAAGVGVSKDAISSPVGYLQQKSLHLDDSLSDNLPQVQNSRRTKRLTPLNKADVGVQTENDILTDEAPDFRALPPTAKKYELIGEDATLFHTVDDWVIKMSEKRYKSLKKVVRILVDLIEDEPYYRGREDLIKVRAFFRWTTENISYDYECMGREMTSKDIMREKMGVCRQYVQIFCEMCEIAGIRVKNLRGFAKGHTYVPGTTFTIGGDGQCHAWNAVFIYGGWRLLDCTWGAGKTNADGKNFEKQLNEHFFLTDPDELIYTHFPYDEVESHYERWQLLDSPISLDTFNALPLLNSMFFEYSLRLGPQLPSPIIIQESINIDIWAWEVVRYKYKFFAIDKPEGDTLNQYVLCYLKGRQRKLCHFHLTPPDVGQFFLKVYAKPEEEIMSESDTLDHIATFLIHVQQVKNKPHPLPRSDIPWGLTQAFFATEARIVGITDPIILMVGEKKQDVILKTPKSAILSLCHMYDAEGNELVQDKDRDVKYTVLLNRKNPLPTPTPEDDESSLLPFITKTETLKQTVFTIDHPPKQGFFKLQIFARKKPNKKGRLKIPLVANFLVDYRHTTNSQNASSGGGAVQRSASAATTTKLLSSQSSQHRSKSLTSQQETIVSRRSSHNEPSTRAVSSGTTRQDSLSTVNVT